MFEHIHSKRHNRLSMERLNDLVFVPYNLHLKQRYVLDHDSTLMNLLEVNLESQWITKSIDLIFSDLDIDMVNLANREVEVVAMVEEEGRA